MHGCSAINGYVCMNMIEDPNEMLEELWPEDIFSQMHVPQSNTYKLQNSNGIEGTMDIVVLEKQHSEIRTELGMDHVSLVEWKELGASCILKDSKIIGIVVHMKQTSLLNFDKIF